MSRASSIGTHRWMICGLLFFATTINYIDRQILSLLKPILDNELHWTNAEFGQVNAALLQAQAQVPQAQASLTLQSTNLERTDTLTRQGLVATVSELKPFSVLVDSECFLGQAIMLGLVTARQSVLG